MLYEINPHIYNFNSGVMLNPNGFVEQPLQVVQIPQIKNTQAVIDNTTGIFTSARKSLTFRRLSSDSLRVGKATIYRNNRERVNNNLMNSQRTQTIESPVTN